MTRKTLNYWKQPAPYAFDVDADDLILADTGLTAIPARCAACAR